MDGCMHACMRVIVQVGVLIFTDTDSVCVCVWERKMLFWVRTSVRVYESVCLGCWVCKATVGRIWQGFAQ